MLYVTGYILFIVERRFYNYDKGRRKHPGEVLLLMTLLSEEVLGNTGPAVSSIKLIQVHH